MRCCSSQMGGMCCSMAARHCRRTGCHSRCRMPHSVCLLKADVRKLLCADDGHVHPARSLVPWHPHSGPLHTLSQVADVLRSPYGATAGGPPSLPAERSASVTTAVAATANPGLESAAAPTAPEAASTTGAGPVSSGAMKMAQESAAEQQRHGALTADGAAMAQQPPMQRSSPFAAVQGKRSSENSPRVRCICSCHEQMCLQCRQRVTAPQTLRCHVLGGLISCTWAPCCRRPHAVGSMLCRWKMWTTGGAQLRSLRESCSTSQTRFRTTWTRLQRLTCGRTARCVCCPFLQCHIPCCSSEIVARCVLWPMVCQSQVQVTCAYSLYHVLIVCIELASLIRRKRWTGIASSR
jgi:hypothetical protein